MTLVEFTQIASFCVTCFGAVFAFLAAYWTLKVDDKIKDLKIWVMASYVTKDELDRVIGTVPINKRSLHENA